MPTTPTQRIKNQTFQKNINKRGSATNRLKKEEAGALTGNAKYIVYFLLIIVVGSSLAEIIRQFW
ncbi:hypothetical protein MIR68_005431 [Amoeboaphelidium protococcarum]|nr:hypothetical protein MIR68_005431 [Amoeboaphelidium protococcarum]KAI3646032.1 hypothetical protein MP228_008960 [Amoeboaphelidium protococcarum]KAI3649994.1 hypothetical protein MP228_005626 [Amoeboaphelidium protococcarum]